jgi:hypothetical protein
MKSTVGANAPSSGESDGSVLISLDDGTSKGERRANTGANRRVVSSDRVRTIANAVDVSHTAVKPVRAPNVNQVT